MALSAPRRQWCSCLTVCSAKETIAERYSEERVVVDGKLVTSRGPGTAIEFALMLIKLLAGAEKAEAVKGPMLVK